MVLSGLSVVSDVGFMQRKMRFRNGCGTSGNTMEMLNIFGRVVALGHPYFVNVFSICLGKGFAPLHCTCTVEAPQGLWTSYGCCAPVGTNTWFQFPWNKHDQTRLIFFYAQPALVAQHWEQSRARQDTVLEGSHSHRGLVAESKDSTKCNRQPQKNILMLVLGVIGQNASRPSVCSKCI